MEKVITLIKDGINTIYSNLTGDLFLILKLNYFLFVILGVFALFGLIIYSLYRKPKEQVGKVKINKKSIFHGFTKTEIFTMILTAIAIGTGLSLVNSNTYSNAVIYLVVIAVVPLLMLNERRRVETEQLYTEIIVFCQNTSNLIRELKMPYNAIQKTVSDIKNKQFKEDMSQLLVALNSLEKEDCRKVMDIIENKYKYSVLRKLNILILSAEYDSSKFNEGMINTYHHNVAELDKSVKKHQIQRAALRSKYIFLTLLSIGSYWLFLYMFKDTLGDAIQSKNFLIVHACVICGIVIAFYFVDRFFCMHSVTE